MYLFILLLLNDLYKPDTDYFVSSLSVSHLAIVPTKVLMHPVCSDFFTLALPGLDLIQGEWWCHHQLLDGEAGGFPSINIPVNPWEKSA